VTVIAVVVAAPLVVSTMLVLVAVAADAVPANDDTVLLVQVAEPTKYPTGMVRVILPPTGTLLAGVKARIGVTAVPETLAEKLIDVKMKPVMAKASTPTDNAVVALDESLKPAVTNGRAAPSVSPFRVTLIEAIPVAAPLVVRTMVVSADVAEVDVAASDATELLM